MPIRARARKATETQGAAEMAQVSCVTARRDRSLPLPHPLHRRTRASRRWCARRRAYCSSTWASIATRWGGNPLDCRVSCRSRVAAARAAARRQPVATALAPAAHGTCYAAAPAVRVPTTAPSNSARPTPPHLSQACTHCHVESSPKRTEVMDAATADRCLELLAAAPSVHTLDLTGGAPELTPQFRWGAPVQRGPVAPRFTRAAAGAAPCCVGAARPRTFCT